MHEEGNIVLVHLEVTLLFIASMNIQREEVLNIINIDLHYKRTEKLMFENKIHKSNCNTL